MIPIVIQSGDPECRLSTALWRALRPFHSTALIARERIASQQLPAGFFDCGRGLFPGGTAGQRHRDLYRQHGSPARNPQTRDRCGGNCLPTGAKGRGPKWTARHYLRPFRQRYYHSFQQHCRQPSDQPATGDHQLLRRPSGRWKSPSPSPVPAIRSWCCRWPLSCSYWITCPNLPNSPW